MHRVLARISEQSQLAARHDFFTLARGIGADGVTAKLRIWAPLFVHLAMTFRDVNRMYYAYARPANALEHAINAHAQVDATHWQMLVDDLAAIGIDHEVASYGDAMKAIWSERGVPIRHYMYWVLHRAQRCARSPCLKLAAMAAGEASVGLFFATTRRVASLFEAETGRKLGYFGDSHARSEADHPLDLRAFEDIQLDEDTLREAHWIVDDHFEKFTAFLDYKRQITFAQA
jgi:hypothetical protein